MLRLNKTIILVHRLHRGNIFACRNIYFFSRQDQLLKLNITPYSVRNIKQPNWLSDVPRKYATLVEPNSLVSLILILAWVFEHRSMISIFMFILALTTKQNTFSRLFTVWVRVEQNILFVAYWERTKLLSLLWAWYVCFMNKYRQINRVQFLTEPNVPSTCRFCTTLTK